MGFSVAIGTLDAIAARFLKDLGANDKETVIVMLALSIPLVGFMPIAGKFVDRVGPLKAGFMGLIATVPLFVGYGFTRSCLLYTSDAADDLLCVDLGGRRIIKKRNDLSIII